MKKYICTVCGYIFDESNGSLWEDLPDDWVCPLCGADKSEFKIQEDKPGEEELDSMQGNDILRELEANEIAALCSNLAKGCEKQYLEEEAEAFFKLEKYFDNKYVGEDNINLSMMVNELDEEINNTFNKANIIVDQEGDRGAKRSLVWSEKVTRMLKSVLNKYDEKGDAYLENTKVYVCEICGFVYVGNDLPEICPVCKVPNFKMKEIGRD